MPRRNTNILLYIEGQTGAYTGATFSTMSAFGEYVPVSVTISAGTATVVLEGRNGPNDAWVGIDSTGVDALWMVARSAELRVRLSAATGATVRATCGVPVRGEA